MPEWSIEANNKREQFGETALAVPLHGYGIGVGLVGKRMEIHLVADPKNNNTP
jgi:hypothetical protein